MSFIIQYAVAISICLVSALSIAVAILLYRLKQEVKKLRADALDDMKMLREVQEKMWQQTYEANRAIQLRLQQITQESSRIDNKTQHLEQELGRTKQVLNNSHRRYT